MFLLIGGENKAKMTQHDHYLPIPGRTLSAVTLFDSLQSTENRCCFIIIHTYAEPRFMLENSMLLVAIVISNFYPIWALILPV